MFALQKRCRLDKPLKVLCEVASPLNGLVKGLEN